MGRRRLAYNGNLLISMRNTWDVYEIRQKTGRIIRELGGKHSTFKLGLGSAFTGSTTPSSILTIC